MSRNSELVESSWWWRSKAADGHVYFLSFSFYLFLFFLSQQVPDFSRVQCMTHAWWEVTRVHNNFTTVFIILLSSLLPTNFIKIQSLFILLNYLLSIFLFSFIYHVNAAADLHSFKFIFWFLFTPAFKEVMYLKIFINCYFFFLLLEEKSGWMTKERETKTLLAAVTRVFLFSFIFPHSTLSSSSIRHSGCSWTLVSWYY